MSFRVATSLVARRSTQNAVGARRSVVLVPKLSSSEEMEKQAIEQIRTRVQYQKDLMKAHGHSHTEEVTEMWRWVNLTFLIGVPICALSVFYSTFFDEHPHRVEEMPDYMIVRSKEYPWRCGNCDLFDLECWKKCKEELKNSK